MRKRKRSVERCYLCGEAVRAAERTVDHVPPKNLFPEAMRRERNFDRLMTLPAHRTCNASFADKNNPTKRTLKRASVKIDYYGPHEDDLATCEEAAKPLLGTLRTTNAKGPLLAGDEKKAFSDYLGLFLRRTTAREQRLGPV